MILEVAVISCDHSNKEFVEGTSKPGICTQEGYEGDYMCPDCGSVILGKNTLKIRKIKWLCGKEDHYLQDRAKKGRLFRDGSVIDR